VTPSDLARALIREGVSTSCAAGWATPRSAAGGDPGGEVGGDTELFFDLASLTKPLTAVAFVRSGIDRATPLAALLPELVGTPSADVPIELFLAHRSGLDANASLYAPLVRGEAIDIAAALVAAATARRDDASGPPPSAGFAPVYSDLGYILVGAALARHHRARDAGEVIHRLVTLPLGLEAILGTHRELEAAGIELAERAAPTELVPWRGGEIRGVVHDENAWALTGRGGSGHAGMFGTVDAVLAFGLHVVDAADELAWLSSPRPGGTLRAGFDGKSEEGSSAGTLMGPRAFGHLGFTGTSLWIDPDTDLVISLLTNRVHPTRDNAKIRAARPRAHDALVARALLSTRQRA
jgi:CubicO group peptidase (beta-lactamase class C family)